MELGPTRQDGWLPFPICGQRRILLYMNLLSSLLVPLVDEVDVEDEDGRGENGGEEMFCDANGQVIK
jgi:hypothetical protein